LVLGLARLSVPIALITLVLLVPAAPAAGLKAKTSVTTKSGEARLGVKLTSDSRVSDRKRPRRVKVRAGGKTYKLSRVRGASAAVVKLGTWRSGAYRGAGALQLLVLGGKRVKVIVTSLAGTTTLRSKVSVPAGDDAPPGTTDPTTPDPEPDPEPGDITGQQAIDQMTTELRGTWIHDPGTPEYALHMCENGDARYFAHDAGFATERFGKPWTVTDAIIRRDGSKAAIVHVIWTVEHNETGEYQQISRPFNTLLEYANGQWYWEGALSNTGDQASCGPTF